MIDGKSETSLQVLKVFENKKALAEIAKEFDLSLDQVKRLKRYFNYQKQLNEWGSSFLVNQFQVLGLKALSLGRFVKEQNHFALTEILSQVTEQTTREDLQKYIERFERKQARISEFEASYQEHLSQLNTAVAEYEARLSMLAESKTKWEQQLAFISPFSPNIQIFLKEYVGPYQEGFALRKRIDSGFRKTLEKKGILSMNEAYIWVIDSLDKFIEQVEYRMSRGFNTEWDYEKEKKRSSYFVSENPYYQAIRTHLEEIEAIEQGIVSIETDLQAINQKKQQFIKEFEQLKFQNIMTFDEAGIASDLLSERELLRHSELQTIAMKWLYGQGYVTCSEVTLPNKRRADVIGYKDDEIIIIEVKASIADYKRDLKWQEYLPYCDIFYFFMDVQLSTDVGHLKPIKKSLEVVTLDPIEHHCENLEQIKYLINRTLSNRLIYGV